MRCPRVNALTCQEATQKAQSGKATPDLMQSFLLTRQSDLSQDGGIVALRWVDRGPEPDEFAHYARQYTQGWVAYYQNRVDGLPVKRPTDSYWQVVPPNAGKPNQAITAGIVSVSATQQAGGRLPLTTSVRAAVFLNWPMNGPNWIFSCRRCNEIKKYNWPDSEYVDPCAADVMERPEQYFDYEPDTGKK